MTWDQYHSESERLAAEAERAASGGEIDRARRLYLQAAEAEIHALETLDASKPRTLGITAVSAVALLYKGEDYAKARELGGFWLKSGPLPTFAVRQMQELLWAMPGEAQTVGTGLGYASGVPMGSRALTKTSRFPTTSWSLVIEAGRAAASGSRRAIETFCQIYLEPMYAYAGSMTPRPDDPRDLVHRYFTRFLSGNFFVKCRPEKGRLRSYLRIGLRHFASDDRQKRAGYRGGDLQHVPLEDHMADADGRSLATSGRSLDPEEIFNRRWALGVLDATLRGVEESYRAAGATDEFRYLVRFLAGEEEEPSFSETASHLGITVSAVKVGIARLRKRFRQRLRDQIAETVADPAEIDDEIRFLFNSLGNK